MSRILIVDDEVHLRTTLRDYLKDAAFDVVIAENGQQGIFVFREAQPDLVVMDIMMPELDGWEAARVIRGESNVPIIMLTARDEDVDKIAALEMGVDDYLTKPFNPRELLARVRAVLRRSGGDVVASSHHILRLHGLELNVETHELIYQENQIELTKSEFDLLVLFMERPARVFTRMELLEHIHGQAFAGYERTIDVHIKNLRAKLEKNMEEKNIIETIYGVGYRMGRDA